MNQTSDIPDISAVLGEVMQTVDPGDRPLLLAALERLASQRYRGWANEHPDEAVKRGLGECADREEEIAHRVESVFAGAAEVQQRLLADNPNLEELNRTLFEGRPLEVQFAMQAQGERAGAGAWASFAALSNDERVKTMLESCSPLEEANAEFLETLIRR